MVDFWARSFSLSALCRTSFYKFVGSLCCRMHLSEIHADDVVWINGPSLPITDTHCWFEKQVVNEVHPYFMA
jgi:hypothetical protein